MAKSKSGGVNKKRKPGSNGRKRKPGLPSKIRFSAGFGMVSLISIFSAFAPKSAQAACKVNPGHETHKGYDNGDGLYYTMASSCPAYGTKTTCLNWGAQDPDKAGCIWS
jgi:hypothetical protein